MLTSFVQHFGLFIAFPFDFKHAKCNWVYFGVWKTSVKFVFYEFKKKDWFIFGLVWILTNNKNEKSTDSNNLFQKNINKFTDKQLIVPQRIIVLNCCHILNLPGQMSIIDQRQIKQVIIFSSVYTLIYDPVCRGFKIIITLINVSSMRKTQYKIMILFFIPHFLLQNPTLQ